MSMKVSIGTVVLGLGMAVALGAAPASPEAVQKVVDSLVWTGQSSVQVPVGSLTVAFDPLGIPMGMAKVDLILVTHTHGDHLSRADLRALADPAKTVVAGPASVIDEVQGWYKGKTVVLEAGKTVTVAGVSVTPVPAYNIVRKGFHDKKDGYLGYVVDVGGVKLYASGDTERIPEMKGLGCDIALLPLGQTYTMASVEEAVAAALDTGASVAVPYHYGKYEGTEADADRYVALLTKAGIKAQKMKQK